MKKTPFYSKLIEVGASLGTGTWNTAREYSNSTPVEEHQAVRNAVGIIDFSTMSKFDIKGEDAQKFVQKMIVNDVSKLAPGEVLYSSIVNSDGGVFDDTTVYSFSDDHYWIVGSTAGREKVFDRLKEYSKYMRAYVTDLTSAYGLLAVQGPHSRELLNTISEPKIDDLDYFWFEEVEIAGLPVMISRTGFTGELGFELYIAAENAPKIWEVVSEAGKDFDAKYCGLNAVGTIRIEKGLIGGSDYGEDTNPYEVGLGWTVDLDTDFVGHDALKKIKEEGPKRKLMGFRIPDKELVAETGDEIFIDDTVIGEVTSPAWSVTYDISMGMALIDSDYAEEDKKVQIKIDGKLVDGHLANQNLHDPENKRVRA